MKTSSIKELTTSEVMTISGAGDCSAGAFQDKMLEGAIMGGIGGLAGGPQGAATGTALGGLGGAAWQGFNCMFR